jgi:hypothetical protein
MTADDLKQWQKDLGLTNAQAAAALDYSLSGYVQLRTGKSRTSGKPALIDRRTALACAALTRKLGPWKPKPAK